MHYKMPLVFSDNPHLCKKFTEMITALKTEPFDYAISPFSNKTEFEQSFKPVRVYDLKKSSDIYKIAGNYDLIISLYCKQIFPSYLIRLVKCINVHPGYNPVNRGWYAHVFAIINNMKIGATIYEMDKLPDHGNITGRMQVTKEIFDTSLTLYQKIVDAEMEFFTKLLPAIMENNYTTLKPENEGNLFLKRTLTT